MISVEFGVIQALFSDGAFLLWYGKTYHWRAFLLHWNRAGGMLMP